jgi:two-component system response regulator AtoC
VDRRVLIVDDGPEIVSLLRFHLKRQGYVVETASTGAEAVHIVEGGFNGVVILDLMLPDFEGLDLFQKLREINEDNRVIILTAYGTFELVAEAVRMGAFDFLSKGDDIIDRLMVSMRNAHESLSLHLELRALQSELVERRGFGDIVAQSEAMERVFKQLQSVIATKVTVLILGESGTGKELFARAIHNLGPRKDQPFIAINCAGIPGTLLESELFGYEKGAFTGAFGRKIGKFEQAHRGTIFLDEIGEMDPALQAKILRVLQEKEFERVGGTEKIRVDARVLSATNRNLQEEVRAGTFRQDLFYRLAVFQVELPPLRERTGDVPLLAQFFAERFAREEEREVPVLSKAALDALELYDFPGNVRELQNIINHASVLCTDGLIRPEHFPSHITGAIQERRSQRAPSGDLDGVLDEVIRKPEDIPRMSDVEAHLIERAIQVCDGNVSRAGDLLGVSRATMYRRVSKLGLRSGGA